MTVQVYRSTDASAPVLQGTVGSLIALLDACLVNGYGAKTAAGWTKAFSGVNKGAYRQNASGANNSASPMYLYVDDAAPGAGGAREARLTGFETMTAITPTGTGQFPTAAQSTIGVGAVVVRKSTTADTTARAWTLIANGQTLYLFTETGDTVTPYTCACMFIFGDIKSYKAADLYAVTIIGRMNENSGQAWHEMPACIQGASAVYTLQNTMLGHFMARHWTGLGGSVKCGKIWEIGRIGNTGTSGNINGTWNGDSNTLTSGAIGPGRFSSTNMVPYPHGPDGAMLVSPIYINHNYGVRGYLPGLWAPLHDRPLAHNDTMTFASGTLNGKSVVCQYNMSPLITATANVDGINWLVETSDTWS